VAVYGSWAARHEGIAGPAPNDVDVLVIGDVPRRDLLAAGHIERVQGAQADGASWLDRARRGLEAAQTLAESAPDSSVVLAYDAARQACVALLAQQGLRPTTA